MPREFRLQDPGEGIHEAEILEIEPGEGDRIEEGEVLLSVETDKAAVEIPSPFTGTVDEIRVEVGERVEVGAVLLTYTLEGEEAEEGEAEEGEAEEEEEPGGEDAEEEDAEEDEPEEAEGEETEQEEPESEEPEEEEPDGEEDEGEPEAEEPDEKAEEGEPEDGEEPESEEEPEEDGEESSQPADRPVPAAPATRRRARELGVDLHRVSGSGPGGRVTREDVEAAAEEGPEEARPPEEKGKEAPPEEAAAEEEKPDEGAKPVRPSPLEPVELPDFGRWGEVERIPFRSVRRTTAERMARSWRRIPHVTHMDVADVTDLEHLRREHEGEVEEAGGRLTLTVLVMKAAVSALKEHPRFNASLDVGAEEIVLKRYYHFGVAVDTERGLVVPVVPDVDRKSVAELAVELGDLVDRARDGELKPDEMRGATFTITNPGPIGGTAFTPIVNWPQVAILGLGRARLEPVVRGDLDEHELEARLRLPLALGFDHRVNDGADAARFVRHLTETLADPDSFLLSV